MQLLTLSGWWLLLAAGYVALLRVHDLRGTPMRSIIILLLAGFVYAISCRWLHNGWPKWDRVTSRRMTWMIVLGAIGFRLLLIGVPPSLSDDIYRYRWDGRVQAAGINPYAEPPAAAELAPLRDPAWLRINYPEIRTIYGPIAQWLFALTYRVDGRLIAFQATAALGDLLVIALLLACLRRWQLPEWRVAIWAWSPLAAFESASNGHFDSWPIAAVMLAVYASLRGAQALFTSGLAAGVLLKTWPFVFVPLALARRPRWHVGLLVGIVVAGHLPYLDAGFGLIQPWLDYTGRWLFNDAGFFVLRGLTGSQSAAKGIAAAIGVAMLYTLWRRGTDPIRGGYWLLLLALFLMPTIHPWYLLWPLPLAAAALDLGWITVTILAPLSYWILVGAGPDPEAWVEPVWVRFAIWLPALALWAWQTRQQGPPAPPAGRVGGASEPVR